MTINLYNTASNDAKGDVTEFIKFVEPCPKVKWAGILNRDRSFVINTESSEKEQKEILKVIVFNPDHGTSIFNKKLSDRLRHVYLKYRRHGEGEADWVPAQIDLDDGTVDLDFAADYAEEDDYGYISLDWYHGGYEGKYDIMVETTCDKLGGPDAIDSFREEILSGVIDVTRPDFYGEPLPIRNDVILGEEVSIIFTEPIDCGRPFTFEIEVLVNETNYRFVNDQLLIICEGRKIGFQIDPGMVLQPELLLGKSFEVTIGSIEYASRAVKDLYGNEMQFNYDFRRRFADINLADASTSFDFNRKLIGADCASANLSRMNEEVKDEIASILDISNNRLSVSGASCNAMRGEINAKVQILPSSSMNIAGGRALGVVVPNAIQLFHNLKNGVDTNGNRRLIETEYSVRKLNLLPSAEDVSKFQTAPENVDRERELHYIGSLRHNNSGMSAVNDFKVQELMNNEKKIDIKMTDSALNIDAMKEELRELKEELKLESERENEQRSKDMKELLFAQGTIIFVVCSLASFAMYVQGKRN